MQQNSQNSNQTGGRKEVLFLERSSSLRLGCGGGGWRGEEGMGGGGVEEGEEEVRKQQSSK